MWRPDPAAARPDLAQLPLLPPRAARIRGAQGRPRRRSAGTLHRRRARGVLPRRRRPHPHRLLRPPQRTKAPQDAQSAPRGRHGAMADAIHAGAVASPWREPEKRHGDMATIWRRYSDALTTMVMYNITTLSQLQLNY